MSAVGSMQLRPPSWPCGHKMAGCRVESGSTSQPPVRPIGRIWHIYNIHYTLYIHTRALRGRESQPRSSGGAGGEGGKNHSTLLFTYLNHSTLLFTYLNFLSTQTFSLRRFFTVGFPWKYRIVAASYSYYYCTSCSL